MTKRMRKDCAASTYLPLAILIAAAASSTTTTFLGPDTFAATLLPLKLASCSAGSVCASREGEAGVSHTRKEGWREGEGA